MSEEDKEEKQSKHPALEIFREIKDSEIVCITSEHLAKPVIKELGLLITNTLRILNLVPSGVVWSIDKVKEFLDSELTRRLSEVPVHRLMTPDPVVFLPAAYGLMITGHNEMLRDMFAKLLATAMNLDTYRQAHPSFAEIIRQMSPDEARIMIELKKRRAFPAISLLAADQVTQFGPKNFYVVVPHFSLIGFESKCEAPELVHIYVINLARLGLIEIQKDVSFTDESRYTPLEKHEWIEEEKQKIERIHMDEPGKEKKLPYIRKETVQLTSLGSQFCMACVE